MLPVVLLPVLPPWQTILVWDVVPSKFDDWVTVVTAVAVQPLGAVTVTEYVPTAVVLNDAVV